MVPSQRARCAPSVARATHGDLLSNAKFFMFLLLIVVLAAGWFNTSDDLYFAGPLNNVIRNVTGP